MIIIIICMQHGDGSVIILSVLRTVKLNFGNFDLESPGNGWRSPLSTMVVRNEMTRMMVVRGEFEADLRLCISHLAWHIGEEMEGLRSCSCSSQPRLPGSP